MHTDDTAGLRWRSPLPFGAGQKTWVASFVSRSSQFGPFKTFASAAGVENWARGSSEGMTAEHCQSSQLCGFYQGNLGTRKPQRWEPEGGACSPNIAAREILGLKYSQTGPGGQAQPPSAWARKTRHVYEHGHAWEGQADSMPTKERCQVRKLSVWGEILCRSQNGK